MIRTFLASLLVTVQFLAVDSASAQACPQFEAQFVGRVSHLNTVKIDQGQFDCFIRISFSEVKPSGVCPLHIGTVDEIYAGPQHCENLFEMNQEISGILIQSLSGQTSLEDAFH